jgi:hypothetical protein
MTTSKKGSNVYENQIVHILQAWMNTVNKLLKSLLQRPEVRCHSFICIYKQMFRVYAEQ